MTATDPHDQRRHKITHTEATETACGIEWDNNAPVVLRPRRTPQWGLVECGDCLDTRPTIVAAGGWSAPSETIYGVGEAGITRDRALWQGLVEPTPEERQAAADALYAQETEDNANWFHTGVMLEEVKRAHFGPIGKAILDLHQRSDDGHCYECSDEREVQWPCATARVVLKSVGIKIPDELVYDKPRPVLQDPDNPRWPFPAQPVKAFSLFDIPEVTVNRGGLRYPTPGDQR